MKDDKEILNLINNIVGDRGLRIVSYLFTADKADEFEIAKELDEDVNYVRSVMYKMLTHNLVNYTRRRDPERGWYIYTWWLSPSKLYNAILSKKKAHLDQLYKDVEMEKNKEQEFCCDKCNINFPFDKALSLNFTCFACGGMLTPLDNTKKIDELRQKIDRLSEEIGLLRKKMNDL